MFKRKLFKRALPIILSVAMIFQSMPATALAAESPAQEITADSETLDESTDDASSDVSKDSASSDKDSDGSNSDDANADDNTSEDSDAEEMTPAKDNSEESASEETSVEENTSSESISEEINSEEKESEENSSEEESFAEITSEENVSEETTAPEETSTETQPNATEEMEKADQTENTAKTATVVIDEEELRNAIEEFGLQYDDETNTIFALYDADNKNPFGEILKGYYNNAYSEDVYFFKVELEGKDNLDLSKQLHCTWKGADGKDLAGIPHSAGSYQLEIKLDKIDNVCSEASTTLSFRIDSRSIMVNYDDVSPIKPGTTVKEVTETITEEYQLSLTNINGDSQGDFLNKEAFVASCAVSIVRERAADGKVDGSTLKAEDVIKSNEEYSVKLEITLRDKDNYTLSNTSRKLEVASGVDTEIKANSIQTDGTNFGWLYGEKPEMEALIKAINPYVVELDNSADIEQEQKVTDAKLQYQWLDADKKELEEAPSDETKIPEGVKDAGTYYLRISYAGDAGHYNPSETDIKIAVGMVDVYIGDIQTDTDKYMEGTKVQNALQTIKSYKVYKAGDEAKTDIMQGDKYFWGVSYNGDADENTQSYEPVFKIRRGQHVTDKDGKDSVVWESDYLADSDSLIKTKKEDDKEITYEYRIEFSGKKAVYGMSDVPVDINESQANYRVDVTAAALADNAFTINVEAATGPVIDVSKILENKDLTAKAEADKGSLKNPLTKVYDDKPLYNTKNDYKEATIKDRTDVPSTDLTYQWQKITGYTEIVNDDNSIDINVDENEDILFSNVEYASAPKDAGNYRLAINYTDSKTGAVSKTEYVYYTIQKEDILIEPKSSVPAYYGEYIGEYLDDIKIALQERTQSTESETAQESLIDYTISDFTEGKENGELANAASLLSELKYREKNENGALTWTVERKITEGDKAGSWYELQNGDTFVENGEYRLTVSADWQEETSLLQNYNNRYELDFKNEQIKDEQTGEYKLQTRYADKQSVAITPAQTQGIEVNFEVDWDKITQTTKVYDGETFDDAMLNAVKSAVKAYNTKTGAPIDPADITFGWEWVRRNRYDDEEYTSVGEKEAIHAGEYYLTLSVEKGEKYIGQKEIFDDRLEVYKKFVILPSELTVTPELKDEIKAETQILSTEVISEDDYYIYSARNNAKNVKNIIKSIAVTGNVADADKTYIFDKVRYYENSEISYPWCVGYEGMRLDVTDKTTGQLKTGYLRGDRAYNVSLDGEFQDETVWNSETQKSEYKFYGTDYTLKFATVSFKTVRASSHVGSVGIEDEIEDVEIRDSITKENDKFTHAITPREGIPYSYTAYNKERKEIGGNYFIVNITAPLEYTDVQGAEDKVIYQNSIEKAGGYIYGVGVEDEWDSDYEDYFSTHRKYITAVFDAAKIAENENGVSFEITWEEGFTETFQITVPKNLLMEDLAKAVLPKSLAFNGASAKMTVGEGQQLDLKITKAQMADTICVAYESSDEKILTVSDSGYVTAIHTGKATVMAYAAYQDQEDGTIKPFLDAKGNYAKAAKLNITVNKLSEVKKIKLEAHDTYAYIDYADVPDGYRREVYVLEGTNVPAAEFDEKINAVKNGNYNAFVAHLFITATERNAENAAGKKFWGKITGLEPNTQYTVYVRNVCALRNFPNGEQIDASEFAIAAKPAKLVTTKSQPEALNAYFKTVKGNQPVYGKTSIREDEKSLVVYDGSSEKYVYYIVDISAKSIKLDVEAEYWQKDQTDIHYADDKDYIWYPLALTKELQKDYINPKLTYYVTNDLSSSAPDNWKELGFVKAGDYYFLPTTSKATIDKSGKLSLKGNGVVYVFAYDAEKDKTSKPINLVIKTAVDSFAGKAIKMKVGNTINLRDYLTYKQGKIKLASYSGCNLEIQLEDTDNAFEIIPQVDEGSSVIYNYLIKAKRPTSKPLDLVVSDKTVKANGGNESITIKLSASALDPVKSLKAYDVYDTEGSIRFDYAGGMDSNLKFRIEVKDQTGKTLKNELIDTYDDHWKTFAYKNAAFYDALYHHNYSEHGEKYGFREYNAKKNTYTYYYDLKNLDGLGLTRQSSYTVSVTAVYDGYDAKTVSTKIKTTNIPASKINAIDYDNQGKDEKNDGGGNITVYKDSNIGGNLLISYPLLKSGNTYTLDFADADSNARKMKTDTLTWKSSNTKVATIKANPGTFTATLKAVKKGTTQITVTSKITKKIVARWTIFVNAVGEADGYFGDNIFQDINDAELVDKLGADLLTLNNSMTFTLTNGEKKWVAFKAPSDGIYSAGTNGGSFIAYDSDSRPISNLGSSWTDQSMDKGEIVYFLVTAVNNSSKKPPQKASVTIRVSGTQYTALSIGENGVKVRGGDTIVFTAPEENVYTFTALDKNGKDVSDSILSNNKYKLFKKDEKKSISVNGSVSEEYTIKVTPAEQIKDGTKIDMKAGETKYYQFTAEESNEYTIYTTGATEKIANGILYDSNLNWLDDAVLKPSSDTDTNPKNIGFSARNLKKASTFYIALTAGAQDTTAAFKVEKAPKIGESFTIAQAGGTRTVVYTANKDGEYRFIADGTKAIIESIAVNDSFNYNNTVSWQGTLNKGDYVKLTVRAEDANTSVTVSCTPVEPITVRAGEAAKSVKVTNGLSQKIAFTALENGWYAFHFDKNTVQVSEATSNRRAITSGAEFYAKAGDVQTFTIKTLELTEQTVNVSVTKSPVEKLVDTTITLTKGKTYRYYWTAENEGLYDFTLDVTGADVFAARTEGAGEEDDHLPTINGYYSKGETFYLTIMTDSDADGSFKAVITKQDAEELTSNVEKEIKVGANASKWVSFTSKWSEKVRYQYTKTNAEGFEFYESTGLGGDGDTEYYPFYTGSRVLRPGQKVYYRIENNNAEEKTIKLKIAPVLTKEINVAAGTGAVRGTDTIKAGTNGWYHFHAANAGRYNISVTSKTGDTTTEISYDNVFIYRDLTAEEDGYNSNVEPQIVNAEKDLYIKVFNDTATDAETTVTITDMAAAATPLELDASGKAAKTLTLKKGVTQYLLFNAKETAHYTLTAADQDKKTYTLPVKYYIDREEENDTSTPINAIQLNAGSTVLFAITTSEDVNVTVTLTKESVTELTNEPVSQTIKAGQTLYFRAKIGAKDSRYFIETSGVAEGLTLTYERVSGWLNWNNGYADFVPSSSQEEVVFGLTASSTFDNTKTFQIKKGIVTPSPIKAGTPAESGELAAYHKVWYRFTPEKTGRYSIKASGAQVYQYNNGIKNSGNWIATPGEFIVTDEMVGKETIYAIYHTDTTAAKKTKLSIAEVTTVELTPEKPYTVDITKVELDEKIWLHFKAANDGRYTFTTSNTGAVSFMQWYKAIDDSTSNTKYFGSEYCINANEEYYIAIPYRTKAEKNFDIRVSAITDSTAEAVNVSETAKELTMNAGEEKWLKFRPTKTANYTFELSNVESAQMEQYDNIAASGYTRVISNDNTYTFAANKTVYFKLNASSSLPDGSKPSIKITAEDMQALTEGANTIDKIAENETKYAFFTPTESAVYSFELTDNTDCSVQISGNGTSYETLSSSGEVKRFALDQEHPTYIKVEAYSTSAFAKILIKKAFSIGEMQVGDAKDVNLTRDSNIAFYKFTAPEDGVYIFDSNSKNTVYIYASDNIGNELLNPDSGSWYGRVGSSTIELKKGTVKYIRVAESRDNLSSSDEFTLTCKKAKETNFTGVDTINLNLKSGEPVLVRWTAGAKGNYQFGFRVTDGEQIKYIFCDSDMNGSYSSPSSNAYVKRYESSSLNGRNLILEASGRTQVEVSAQIVPRSISVGRTETVVLDSSKRFEEFNFYMQGGATYVFCTTGVDSAINSYIIDPETDDWYGGITYYLGNERYWIYYTPDEDNKKYKFRVESADWSNSGDTFSVTVYSYNNCGYYGLNSNGLETSEYNVQSSGENWYQLSVNETSKYGFGASDSYVFMKLYRKNGSELELLGTKEPYNSNRIWSTLQQGDTVLLQTCYKRYHSSGNYSINVTCDLQQTIDDNWTISESGGSKEINIDGEYETIIPLTFNELSDTTKYGFSLKSSYNSQNIEMALYQIIQDSDSDNVSKILLAEGQEISYAINPNDSYELCVSNYGTGYWSGTIRANIEYDLTLENNAKEVTVVDGSEAWFYFTVPEDGNYLFYGTADVQCDNYAELWVNNEKVTDNDDDGGNGQFLIQWTLYAGDIVKLNTYRFGHNSEEITYTVHIEKVPEDYNSLAQMTIASSTDVSGLAVGETKKYRFIAPASKDNSNKVRYMFYSQMYNSSEGIELTANISLASEVSAYTLDTIQKDDNGNFYYIVELTPGRPYIFSITNNGNSDLSSTNVYAYQYTAVEGGNIGGSTQSASTAINGAAGAENWISYTVEEDGIYTFTVSDASDYGYLNLYQVEDSQLTQLKQQYFSSGNAEKIANIILNKGDQIILRIYQSSYQELTCNVQASWAIWEITSVESGSNTQSITTNTSGEEGKVWLTFDSSIPEGKYTISTANTSDTLTLYKNGEEVASTPDNNTEAQGNTVTFPYQRNENDVYQLGITATGSSVTLAITKEPESETPGEGDNSDGNGDGSDNNGDNTGDSGNAGESEGSGDNTGDNTNNGSGDTNNSDNTSNGATTGDGNNTDN